MFRVHFSAHLLEFGTMGAFFFGVVVGLRQYDDVVGSYVNASWLLSVSRM